MLCQFSFENFKSFRDEALLDFCAENITEHEESLIKDEDGEKFLPTISIYGPNGGGKSTVLEALVYLKTFIIRYEAMVGMGNTRNGIQVRDYSGPQYFLFRKNAAVHPMKFDILFRHNGLEYRYYMTIIGDEIENEELYYRKAGSTDAILLIERTPERTELGKELNIGTLGQINRKMPLLSYISLTFGKSPVSNAYDWFCSITDVDYDEPGLDKVVRVPKEESYLKERFIGILNDMDISIKDYRVEKDQNGHIKNIYTVHEVDNEDYELDFRNESSGTRKIVSCLSLIIDSLIDGRLLIADELDAKLHPSLLGYVIKLFTDPEINRKGAQLLITSHDIVNMNSSIFRRDEIWFCAMGGDSASNLYSLISFRDEKGSLTRKDAVYSKQYLEGRYGADPYIMKATSWEDPQ